MWQIWPFTRKFPFYKQLDSTDCGPTCLRMIAHYYGKTCSLQSLRDKSFATREGVSLLGISEAAKVLGMNTLAVTLPFAKLDEVPLPCIAHWKKNHFIVIHKVKKEKVYVADPAHGLLTYTREEFVQGWQKQADEGFLLLLEPTHDFFTGEAESTSTDSLSFKFIGAYIGLHKAAFGRILLLMLVGASLQFALPFLTQAVVDIGIQAGNLNVLYLILLAQFMLYVGQTTADFIRSRILLRLGTRINITIISDFLTKLMRLPLAFFDVRVIGDILQRIQDHYRIESFITSSTLSILLAAVNALAFGVALIVQSFPIFLVFLLGSTLYLIWVSAFMKKRREFDYKRFDQLADNQGTLIQLIRGMSALKLNNAEEKKRWEWQRIQEKLYEINISSLILDQYQQGGGHFINQIKNLVITFLSARYVILGQLTLGEMMAVQMIVGQLSAPIMQLIGFMRMAQNAQISLERLSEVHRLPEEDSGTAQLSHFPPDQSLTIRGLDFQYEGPFSPYVFQDLTLHIPQGKITAVVGPSGSGKTTLLKLLLKFYQPQGGQVLIGDLDLFQCSTRRWRQKCGVVMQDGYLFADTIAHNIALSDERVDPTRLHQAATTANIHSFIESLPLQYDTKIGQDGHQLSLGQRQRILIARAVYKNPDFLFFDEATNSLDATNEKIIMGNLAHIFPGKTVVIIAHRLSTVRQADQIVVLDQGRVREQGTHTDLLAQQGVYYRLVQDQLT